MAAAANVTPEYFYEDVVYRVDKRGNVVFGIVMENDDHDMSEESTDSEESLPKRKKGEIRMIWHPSGIEELVNSKKVQTHILALVVVFIALRLAQRSSSFAEVSRLSYYLAYQYERRHLLPLLSRIRLETALKFQINGVYLSSGDLNSIPFPDSFS